MVKAVVVKADAMLTLSSAL